MKNLIIIAVLSFLTTTMSAHASTVIQKRDILSSVVFSQTNTIVVVDKVQGRSHRLFTTCTLPLRKNSDYSVSASGSIREGSKITLRAQGRSQRCSVVAIAKTT